FFFKLYGDQPEQQFRIPCLLRLGSYDVIRLASRSRTANKGVVLSCRGIRKPLGHPEQESNKVVYLNIEVYI
ncbi:hypothetical protein, partial [Klebsiella variicola]|uniref:hypothetical protein n=1 Tax=Klebsiella variicola TaxID=244366 RepID=UPI00280A78E3